MPPIFERLSNSVKAFATKYPAILSGLIIYAYLLYSIIHYLLRSKTFTPTFYDVFETFDALPFMWLLSLTLVKIIEVRVRLHESETERIRVQNEIALKQTQLRTLHEVVKSLQHHINNPLAIISLTLGSARRHAQDNVDLIRQLETIEESTQRIVRSMREFFQSQTYETEQIDPVVGSMTALPSAQGSPSKTPDPHT